MGALAKPSDDERDERGHPGMAGPVAALVADAAGVGMWLIDAAGETLYRNASLDACAGDVSCLEELATWLPGVPLWRYIEGLRQGAPPIEEPAVLLRRPGQPGRLIELRLAAGPLPDSLLIAMRDVTDRARLQRLGALVETAMALGHEIANPLAILRGELDLLEAEVPAAATTRLARMRRAADRIGGVLDRLRKLAEPGSAAYLPSRGVRMVDLEVIESPNSGEDAR